jgi:hypothetical protein
LHDFDKDTLDLAGKLNAAVSSEIEKEEKPSLEAENDDTGGSAEDPGKEETVEPEPKAEEEKPEIPEELVEKAIRLGMSMKDVKRFSDAEHLENVLKLHEKPEEKKEEPEEDGEDLLEGVDPDLIDEGTHNALKRIAEKAKQFDKVLKENEGLKKSVDEMSTFVNHQRSLDLSRRYDSVFSELEDEERIGKDTSTASPEQIKLRMEILTEAGIMAESYNRLGRKLPEKGELVRRAAEIVLGSDTKKKPGQKEKPYIGVPSGKQKPQNQKAEIAALGKQLSVAARHL